MRLEHRHRAQPERRPARAPLSRTNPTGPTGPTGGEPGAPSIVRDPAASTACGKLATTLASDAPLLADRLRIRVPAGVNLAPRAYSIMSSPTPPEEESRVMIGGGASAGTAPGDSAFVLLARETWQLDTDRARAEADAPVQPGPLDEEARKFLHATTGNDSLVVARARVADAAITLPENYVAVHQPGPDFDTYKLLRLRPLSLYPGSVTVSVDAHPDRDVPPGAAPEKSTLLGRPVTWHAQRSPRGGAMVATQPLAAGKSSDRRFVQVTIIATRQARFLDEFRRVAESLARVPRAAGSSPP